MTIKSHLNSSAAPIRPALMADMARYGVVFSPDPDPGPTGDPTPEPKKPDPKPESKPPAEDPMAEALRKQVAELEARLKGYGDATPDEIKALREVKAKAEAERKAAEDAARVAEEDRLRKEGDFEALRKRMAEEHQKELDAARSQSTQLNEAVSALQRQIEDMALSTSFASSRFVQEETIIGADKARRIYGAHFDVVDGQVVGFDAPRGAQNRVPLVDGSGKPLPFDQAIQRLVDADPDRDRLLKAQQKPGPGTQPSPGARPPAPAAAEPRGAARLAKTLPKLLGR